MNEPCFLGIDIGTQGVRAVLLDVKGNQSGSAEKTFPLNDRSREEQSPQEWWTACQECLQGLLTGAQQRMAVQAISVTSTSGTIIPLDTENEPLHPAIMYSDSRSAAEAVLCSEAAREAQTTGYAAFNASCGLPKMYWFLNRYPEKAAKISRFIHATDFIIGKLSGNYTITDYTNALKSGYDVRNDNWPGYIFEQLPFKKKWFPQVVPSGTVIGNITAEMATLLGLPASVQVVAGMTDGCAAQMASGAVKVGDWNTTIGTTLVVKGVTKKEINDPEGRLYCHRHPEGYWMPGGASNTGGDWVTREFGTDLSALNREAANYIPTRHFFYPLQQNGERFPFIAPQARGFRPENISGAALFAAGMEGVAYVERCAYELIKQLSGEAVTAVYTAGGGSNSDIWLKIRSSVLNLPVYKMKYVTGAVGAAILAAAGTHFGSVSAAATALTQIEKEVHPDKEWAAIYEQDYGKFIDILAQKGYIKQQ
ncbi:FGGY-family carbohydrate kinase [Chitinophaga sp. MM2321]|uniref:FGGY-family carbohydrate kinase n=1 Tax=Chitinophaga sp. MM2321 TaxID=3137178 RepID=UPI0032D5B10C